MVIQVDSPIYVCRKLVFRLLNIFKFFYTIGELNSPPHLPTLLILLFFFSLQQNMTLLEDECMTVEESGIEENQQILIEGKKKYNKNE